MRVQMLGDFAQQIALDLKIFRHCLDDPIALLEPGEVVFEVADAYQLARISRSKRSRLGGLQLKQGAVAQGVPVPALGSHVQQQNGQTGVGHMRGDARTHRPGAQNGNTADAEPARRSLTRCGG